METNEVYEKIIIPAIDELNASLNENQRTGSAKETRLIGEGASLDSLQLVSLIVLIEEHAYSQTGKQVTIASEKAVARASSPFKTVNSLTDYVHELLA